MVLSIFGQPMRRVYKLITHTKIRLGLKLNLIFFVLFLAACKQETIEEIRIDWKDNQARGIIIPIHLLKGNEAAAKSLAVRLESSTSNMLGDYRVEDDYILFQPLVPLTRGLKYEIFFRQELLGRVAVLQAEPANAPEVLDMYPSADSLPENLLKIYLQFSKPMQEGVALQNLALVNEHGDTLSNTFLDLQQELWNKEGTVLTVWLDPGRIKRDLIPNRQMGNPLQKGSCYTLTVSNNWKDVQGLALQQPYSKKFFVRERDDVSPQPESWKITAPQAASKGPLRIALNESLDYFLLQETITVLDETGNKIGGAIKINAQEKELAFSSDKEWKKGRYRLRIASYLEDIAGNNLMRPFDRDITRQVEKKVDDYAELEFVVGD